MASIYTRMAGVSNKLLRPASGETGTFGQGKIELVRLVPGAPPAEPWEMPGPGSEVVTELKGAARGISADLVGSEVAPGVQLKATDLVVIVAPWGGEYDVADVVRIDGKDVTLMRVDRIPAAGTVSAFRFYVRR